MREVLLGAGVLVVSIFAVGFMGRVTPIPSSLAAAEPDIVIRFRGLMVFDKEPRGGEQVVRLHSDADDHKVSIRIKGPEFDDFMDWGHDYPKGADLKFEVVNRDGPVAASASWATRKPYKIADLHPESATLGELYRIPDAFGPTFTFHAGTFSSGGDIPIEFVSTVKTVYATAPRFVLATIDLRDDQELGLLTGAGLPRVPLRKPKVGEPKWEIDVSNDPDLGHVCGYHFIHYYDGFRFRKGTQELDVPADMKYVAKPTGKGVDPCDARPQSFDQVEKRKEGQTSTNRMGLTFRPVSDLRVVPALKSTGPAVRMIPTRPCIPISG